MSVESEYDAVAKKYRSYLQKMIAQARVILSPDGAVRLDDVSSKNACEMMRAKWDTQQISDRFKVPESAVYNGIYLYRKYERELIG